MTEPADREGLVTAPMPGTSARAASILLDILGAEEFADEAVTYVNEHMTAPLSDEHQLLVKLGAVKAAQLVMNEVRKFAERDTAKATP